MTMAQARIVVRDSALESGQKLLKATQLGSLSELFNVLVSRYGNHLISTWVVPAGGCLCTNINGAQQHSAVLAQEFVLVQETDLDDELTGV